MSGSGGGGGGAYDGGSVSCEKLVFDTQLSSPKDDVIALLKRGDVLPVEARTMGATTVVVAVHNGQIAGGLASPALQRLRQCLSMGYLFKAQVTSIDDGQIRVRVSGA